MSTPVVAVTDVFVRYAGAAQPVMALRGADLILGPGERLLVAGPNGSGKSTLLRVVTGDQPVLAGRVEVGGEAVHTMSAAERRAWRTRALGFVDQHARRNLLPELDVLENVALQLRLTGTPTGPARDQARDTLDRLGLAGLAAADVGTLSGGEAQRVALCAAVAHRPALLLADEPTGELDEDAGQEVHALIEAVAGAGTGVILVSHDARSVRFVDRAVRLRDGRLAEQWTPGSPEVTQVPDSRGWVRLPTELLADPRPAVDGYVAQAQDGALLLRSRTARPAATETPVPLPVRRPVQRDAATDPLLTLEGVAAGYGSRRLVDHLDLSLTAGLWVAVRGPSGSGKSTLLALVAGLVGPMAGRVRVAGTDWADLDRRGRAGHRGRWLAVASQRPALVETMTVRENLALAAAVRPAGPTGPDLDGVVDALGLTGLLDGPAAVLSGGERQRVALARALVSPARLLVLDEPTSQQDDASAARVVRVLQAQVAAGRAVLVASHEPAVLEQSDLEVRLDAHGPHQVVPGEHGTGQDGRRRLSRPRGPGPGRAAGPPGSRR